MDPALAWLSGDDAKACEAAIELICRSDCAEAACGLLGRGSYFKSLTTHYRKAADQAREGLEVAQVAGDVFDYLTSHFFLAWALLHLGAWGEMRETLTQGIETARHNGHHLWVTLLRLELAALHLEALDFQGARALCEAGLQAAREVRHPYAEMLATILLGRAHLGLRQYPQAYQCLAGANERLATERVLMDWILSMPLRYGLAEFWLAQREFTRAKAEAKQLCAQAGIPKERTWLALDHHLLAQAERIAHERLVKIS